MRSQLWSNQYVKDKRTVIPLSTYLDGEYGVKDVCIGVPASTWEKRNRKNYRIAAKRI